MAALGPFESAPLLAVAVSGGADSTALALLAARWARARGGSALALTVDHGLRPESAAEAESVGRLLAARGIAHRILRWDGAKPVRGIQQAARAARYGSLIEACRVAGILHLLVAHQRGDQAETVSLRSQSGSGPDGMAGMEPVAACEDVRVLRPLLDVPRARLEATLRAAAVSWIDDPSNRNLAFARARTRRRLNAAGDAAIAELAESAAFRAGRRRAGEADAARLLARAAAVLPGGYALIDPGVWADARPEVAARSLGRLIRALGGAAHGPSREALARLASQLGRGRPAGRSLGGCLIRPWRGRILVCREPAAMSGPVAVAAGASVSWDGRFRVAVAGSGPGRIAGLGPAGWRLVRRAPGIPEIPAAAAPTLPALFDAQGLAEVPHLGWRRQPPAACRVESCAFSPKSLVTGGLVWPREGTMC